MSNTLVNLARVQSTTLGQGTLTLGAAIAGFNTFSGAGLTDGQTVTYAIEDYSPDVPATVTGREIGQGVYNAGTLTRATVYSSTLAGAKLNCSGRQHVLVTPAAEDLASFATDLTAHLNDTAGAHAASAISFSATGGIASTDVQAAIAELDSEKLAVASNLSDLASASTARTNLGLGTGDSPQFTAIELGNASDTTIARSSAGRISVEGALVPALAANNQWTARQDITITGSFGVAFSLVSTNKDALAGPIFEFTRAQGEASSPGDNLGLFLFRGTTSTGSSANYVQMGCNVLDNAVGAEYGQLYVTVLRAGAAVTQLTVGNGVYIGSPTGFGKGNGTLNAVTIYENNVLLTTKYGQISVANTWSAAQTISVDSAATNTVTTVATLRSTSTGTPAAGIGVALDFAAETAAGNNEIGARISAVTTDVTSTSEDFDLVFSAMAAGAAVTERGRITSKGTYKHQSFTVAGLPAGTAGETAFASNGRKNGEGAAAGTGVLVFHDGTNWCACDTGAPVAA